MYSVPNDAGLNVRFPEACQTISIHLKQKAIMNSVLTFFRCNVGVVALMAFSSGAAPIPGLFNTGVSNNGALLPAGTIDPHWRMIQSPDPAFPGPNAFVLNDGYPINPW